ncbi:putative small protein, possible signal peptide [Cryptosporidium felis]|nr:putative small protein, possible signal peptide [Cryptosporidium felis]
MELDTWKGHPFQEYSLPEMIKKSKSISSINELIVLSPFLNGTFIKTGFLRYGKSVYEFNQFDKKCKHSINYDITIPPENPQGYNSIRVIGYSAFGKALNVSIPTQVENWFHAYHTHIRVPVSVTEN